MIVCGLETGQDTGTRSFTQSQQERKRLDWKPEFCVEKIPTTSSGQTGVDPTSTIGRYEMHFRGAQKNLLARKEVKALPAKLCG